MTIRDWDTPPLLVSQLTPGINTRERRGAGRVAVRRGAPHPNTNKQTSPLISSYLDRGYCQPIPTGHYYCLPSPHVLSSIRPLFLSPALSALSPRTPRYVLPADAPCLPAHDTLSSALLWPELQPTRDHCPSISHETSPSRTRTCVLPWVAASQAYATALVDTITVPSGCSPCISPLELVLRNATVTNQRNACQQTISWRLKHLRNPVAT